MVMTNVQIFRQTGLGAALILSLSAPLASAQFNGSPPDDNHPWAVHDHNRPQPPRVEPGKTPGAPPSDAVVLFDGSEASFKANWTHENPKRKTDWIVKDGAMQSMKGAGYIKTKTEFGDCQLHVEWLAPSKIEGSGQGRGNSGIFLMGMTEVQVLDNFGNPTYADGFAGSVYGIMPPAANPLRGPGQWQSYDIIFRRPIEKDGVIYEGSQTVLINGVVVQDSTPLEGGGGHLKRSKPRAFPEKGVLKLQDHGNPVRFRNIWYRELRKRPVDGGTDGALSPAATTAKRDEIAANIRADAATKNGKDKMLRLFESLYYATDDVTSKEANFMAERFVTMVKTAPAVNKDNAKQVAKAFKYLIKHQLLPADFPPAVELAQLIEANDW